MQGLEQEAENKKRSQDDKARQLKSLEVKTPVQVPEGHRALVLAQARFMWEEEPVYSKPFSVLEKPQLMLLLGYRVLATVN